jgi:hypothetical protein
MTAPPPEGIKKNLVKLKYFHLRDAVQHGTFRP